MSASREIPLTLCGTFGNLYIEALGEVNPVAFSKFCWMLGNRAPYRLTSQLKPSLINELYRVPWYRSMKQVQINWPTSDIVFGYQFGNLGASTTFDPSNCFGKFDPMLFKRPSHSDDALGRRSKWNNLTESFELLQI